MRATITSQSEETNRSELLTQSREAQAGQVASKLSLANDMASAELISLQERNALLEEEATVLRNQVLVSAEARAVIDTQLTELTDAVLSLIPTTAIHEQEIGQKHTEFERLRIRVQQHRQKEDRDSLPQYILSELHDWLHCKGADHETALERELHSLRAEAGALAQQLQERQQELNDVIEEQYAAQGEQSVDGFTADTEEALSALSQRVAELQENNRALASTHTEELRELTAIHVESARESTIALQAAHIKVAKLEQESAERTRRCVALEQQLAAATQALEAAQEQVSRVGAAVAVTRTQSQSRTSSDMTRVKGDLRWVSGTGVASEAIADHSVPISITTATSSDIAEAPPPSVVAAFEAETLKRLLSELRSVLHSHSATLREKHRLIQDMAAGGDQTVTALVADNGTMSASLRAERTAYGHRLEELMTELVDMKAQVGQV